MASAIDEVSEMLWSDKTKNLIIEAFPEELFCLRCRLQDANIVASCKLLRVTPLTQVFAVLSFNIVRQAAVKIAPFYTSFREEYPRIWFLFAFVTPFLIFSINKFLYSHLSAERQARWN